MSRPGYHAEEPENAKRDKIRLQVQRCMSLPSIPAILRPIQLLASDINCSLDDLALVFKRDPASVARLLQMVNSAMYGFSRSIISVRQAILLLGLNAINAIMQQATDTQDPSATTATCTMQDIWLHNYAVALLSQHIAMDAARLQVDQEVAYCAGLLHDIGRVALLHLFPEEYLAMLEQPAENSNDDITQRELDTFHASHAQVGRWLGEQWNFPTPILRTITLHHHPQHTDNLVTIVQLADQLVKSRHIGFAIPDMREPRFHSLLRALNLHPRRVRRYEDYIQEEITNLRTIIPLGTTR